MTTWYRIDFGYGKDSISPVVVLKESAQQLVIVDKRYDGSHQERRTYKISASESYHPTFDEAKSALVTRRAGNITHLEEQLAEARNKLAVAESFTEETCQQQKQS